MNINLWVVLISVLIDMFVGAVWYSPMFFGRIWLRGMKNMGKTMEDINSGAGKAYFSSFVGSVIMAFALAYFIDLEGADNALSGLITAFWLWLGFVFAASLASYSFESRDIRVYLVYVSYKLVSLLLMGIVLASF